MGDVLSLIEETERSVDKVKAEKLATKFKKGKSFDFNDLKDQMEQMMSMGGLGSLMDKLPGMGNLPANVKDKVNDKDIKRLVAIIQSMTPQERAYPDVIKGSRKRRIALGAGVQVQDVNRLMKQQKQMSKMMKKMAGGGMAKMMRGLKGKLPMGGGPGGMGF
jgi:signal recognition particle subunit SRP54